MAIGAQRTTLDLNLGFAQQRAGEAGGIVSYIELSGVAIVGYLTSNLSEALPIGIQLNDVEVLDLSRQYHPALARGVRRVDVPGATVGLARLGVFDTNFVHPDARPYCTCPAYLGPSGLLTHDPGLGGPRVGTFMSNLNDNMPGLPGGSEPIVVFGGGYSREQVFYKLPDGWAILPQGDTPIMVTSPGWVRVRINILGTI